MQVKKILAAIAAWVFSSGVNAYTLSTTQPVGEVNGVWVNSGEPGWGLTITHQFNKIFAAIYTYEANGTPVWYTVSDCTVVGDSCEGMLYRASKGVPLTSHWGSTSVALETTGWASFKFSDANNGTANISIKSIPSAKNITKFAFGSSISPNCPNYLFLLDGACFEAVPPTSSQKTTLALDAVEFLKGMLKAPSSFRMIGDYSVTSTHRNGYVSFTYEAQNSFGVYLRSKAYCSIASASIGVWIVDNCIVV